jgi:hypothetical protein
MIVFHHIPKTAGSTINHSICDANPETAIITNDMKNPLIEKDNYKYIGGHIPFNALQDPKYIHISVLRNPLLRIISYFEMAYRDNAIFREEICRIDKWGFGFEVFYDKFIVDQGLVNISCSFFSSDKNFYSALDCIKKNFTLIADISRMNDFQSILTESLMSACDLVIPESFPEKNKSSKHEVIIDKISPSLVKRIQMDNQEDYRLYRWLIERHNGLYTITK